MENLDRRYVIAGVILLLVAIFTAGVKYAGYLHESKESKLIIDEERESSKNTSEDVHKDEEEIIQIYICGEVKKPGVYRLPADGRLYQAVDMASAKEGADLQSLDMARQLVDGESILVPAVGDNTENSAAAGSTGKLAKPPSSTAPAAATRVKLNINRASVQELDERLPGIGPSLAQRIVDYRSSNGDFKQIEDIKNVSGIGEKKFAGFKDLISVR